MAYCQLQDLIDRFGQDEILDLADDGNGEIDAAKVDLVLGDASAKMDGYLAARYTLPIEPVPTVLIPLCCDISRYMLYDEVATEVVSQRHDEALKLLSKIAKGEVSLGINTNGDTAQQTDNTATVQSDGTVWGRDQSQGFI